MHQTKANTLLELQYILTHIGDYILKYIVNLTKSVYFIGCTVTNES